MVRKKKALLQSGEGRPWWVHKTMFIKLLLLDKMLVLLGKWHVTMPHSNYMCLTMTW